jgi:tetratricopeptide (TPR) repeat protein
MARLRSTDVIHVATTNHRIFRHTADNDRSPVPVLDSADRRRPVVVFHGDLMNERELAAADRDIGVALCRDGQSGAAFALPLLETAIAARPDDVTAMESKAFALSQLGRGEEAMAVFRKVLSQEPDRETALTGAAYLTAHGRHREEAISYWRRDIAVNPWRSEYHAELAHRLFQNRDWRQAAESCKQTLRLNPTNHDIRKLLVRCELQLADPQAARRELKILLGFDPPDRAELLQWLTSLSRSP